MIFFAFSDPSVVSSKSENMTAMKDEIMTIRAVSLYLKIDGKTTCLAKQGELPGVKIAGII